MSTNSKPCRKNPEKGGGKFGNKKNTNQNISSFLIVFHEQLEAPKTYLSIFYVRLKDMHISIKLDKELDFLVYFCIFWYLLIPFLEYIENKHYSKLNECKTFFHKINTLRAFSLRSVKN